MRRKVWIAAVVAAAAVALAAPQLFDGPAESTWSVASGGKPVATVTLLTDGRSARAEWKGGSATAPTIFIATDGKIWVRQPGGDVELSEWKGTEAAVVPVLLAPGSSSAEYARDAEGAKSATVKSGTTTWTLTRTAVRKTSVNAAMFAVNPKKGAATRLAALAGGLGGPADRNVSATAGGRGVERGASFADGGDYDALALLETLDDAWDESTDELTRFQKEGKVGSAKGTRR